METNILIAALVLAVSATFAAAAPQNKSVTCANSELKDGTVTTCKGAATYRLASAGPTWNYTISLKAPAGHCSDVRYIVARRAAVVGVTGWLSAGQSGGVSVAGLPRGNHNFTIEADGKVGGCNEGRMLSWGVAVDAEGWQ